ncbi:MAG: peptide deformylase [Clostridia bacterium]
MAIRNIIENGDEILRKKSREVGEINERILELLDDMVETLHKSNGVGLSAVQVGVLKRVVVIDIYDGKGPIKLINPKITRAKGEVELEEGCLSFPNQYAKVKRAEEVTVEALNEKGKKIKITAKELLAQALQHELDHLEGVLFVDRMIPGTMEYVDPDNNQPVKE